MSNISDLKMLATFPHLCIAGLNPSCVFYICHAFVARLQESSLLVQQASLKGELEGVHQQLESSKVLELSFFNFTNK